MHQQCGKEDVEDPFKGLEKPPGGTNSVILQEMSFPFSDEHKVWTCILQGETQVIETLPELQEI